jgi:hypothetical protein
MRARPVTSSTTLKARRSPAANGSGTVAVKTVCALGNTVALGRTGFGSGVETAGIVGI